MGNSIINKEDALRGKLSNEHYFQSLLEVLYSNHILSNDEMQRIQLQLMSILNETIGYYTKDESSSVREETAAQITSSIYYTIGLSLKNQPDLKEAINTLQKEDLKYLFSQGEEILKSKTHECRMLHESVLRTRLKTGNLAYIDTLDYGIPLFFKQYDARFASQETPGSIDYPLAISREDLAGIDYIEDYLSRLLLENKFCSYFDGKEIEALLRGYAKDSDLLLINIFSLVLTNFAGCILAGKVGKSLEINQEERKYIKSQLDNLSQEAFEDMMKTAKEKIFHQLDIEDKDLMRYVDRTISIITKEIRRHIERDTLKNLFITLKWPDSKRVKFEDGESLEDSFFRDITDEIRDCSSVEDKIEIIKQELHSMRDLIDVFEADCIFADEFEDIFSILGDFEISLLMKYISDEVGWDNDDADSEKEWQTEFRIYFDTLGEERRNQIIRISDEIEL